MFTLHNGDCLTFQPPAFDIVMSDVPYPDLEKGFQITPIDFLAKWNCRQFIFWSAMESFPLDYTAVHIWHKRNSQSAHRYERIFERNGGSMCLVFNSRVVTSPITAQFARDEYFDHPTQKPVSLMKEMLFKFTEPHQTIYDPFMGSGTTGVACMQTGRNFIGCELEPKYYSIAEKRIKSAALQPSLFTPSNNRLHLTGGIVPAQGDLFTPEDLPSEGKLSAPAPRR